MSTSDLQPSKLGTKAHWDGVYSRELSNFHDIGDEGEVWFGEDSVEKMVDWTLENVPADPAPHILEVGTGNGNLLFALCEAGYPPEKMSGIDYSMDAVELARAIASSKSTAPADESDADEPSPALPEADKISFSACDFLRDEVALLPGMTFNATDATAVWDLVLDKGTMDAIALAEKDGEGKSPADGYPARIGRVVKPGGFFLITSCNFTEEELKAKFTSTAVGLVFHSRRPWPTFSFGGQTGNVYSTVAFTKP
ncbi:S-adenosyl-L-methionine-dependent methyltransferase [Epithele typhae]|uniref:S-adenosyl-L-methionine-dependent methyltransferase n=1 Tax=Epithele typhae TaxID=378194 RepID=UPI0020085789|nr:S-adenosyl-L-methionine-dependent methyltransferase [Epithele typhae]KAH9945188.1 S-adenosyl-L-methionine-dependent methyltransferase [Epithele typhae]